MMQNRVAWVFGWVGLVVVLANCSSPALPTERVQTRESGTQVFLFQSAEQYQTAKGTGQFLQKLEPLSLEPCVQADEHFPTLIIDPHKTFQTIEGFGGALTDAAAQTIYKLSEANQEKLFKAYFDKNSGIGYNLFRTHINSCNFSSESYAYAEVDGDVNLSRFSIERDKKFRIPLIQEAVKRVGSDFKLLAAPWSPPAWMKTNQHMLHGGKLKPEYYQTWANYYIKFIEAYQHEKIPVWALSVQNDPLATQAWESCVYTAEEECDFVRNYLGPTLEKNNWGKVKLIVWDYNCGLLCQRAQTLFKDTAAAHYIWGTGFYGDTGNPFKDVKQASEAFPENKLRFTEGCVLPFDYTRLHDWNWGERYGESIIHDLNNGAAGWIDWNIVLDENGGPSHVANYCYAPVIGNTKTDELLFMNSYFYLGHFSKFIRPGAKRMYCSGNNPRLLATAALNTNGTVVVVSMNPGELAMEFMIWFDGKKIQTQIPANAIKTFILK